MHRLASRLTSEVLHLVQRPALPVPPGQPARDGDEPVPGHELTPALPSKAFDRLTTPWGRAAATRFNERPQLSRAPTFIMTTRRIFGRPIVCCVHGEG